MKGKCIAKAEEVLKMLKMFTKKCIHTSYTFSCSVTENTDQHILTHSYAAYLNAHITNHSELTGKPELLTDDFEAMVNKKLFQENCSIRTLITAVNLQEQVWAKAHCTGLNNHFLQSSTKAIRSCNLKQTVSFGYIL